jgi:lipoate-protein ligase A
LTLASPAGNLALDEALLLDAEAACPADASGAVATCPGEVLRFWESPQYFVVLGAGGRLAEEVDVEACRRDAIPILRRASGGGTVLQGPGCLNYTLVLDVRLRPSCADIVGTNRYVLARVREALASRWPAVAARGTSDLALGELKFSGNAQRRKRRHILFHGTLLYSFDFARVEKYLRHPPRQPDYRADRSHMQFLVNLGADAGQLKELVARAWGATVPCTGYPTELVDQLVATRYSQPEWNERF